MTDIVLPYCVRCLLEEGITQVRTDSEGRVEAGMDGISVPCAIPRARIVAELSARYSNTLEYRSLIMLGNNFVF